VDGTIYKNETSRSVRTTATAWVQSIATMLDTVGLDRQALFQAAGLDESTLNDPHGRYPTEAMSRLWETIASKSNNPAIGLAMSHIARPSSLDIITYAMMSCPRLINGLERLERYTRIVSDAVMFSLTDDAEGRWLALNIYGGDHEVPIQRVDYILVTILSLTSWLTGRPLHPLAVEWTHPQPADLSAYRDAFQCPLRFNMPIDRMLFSHEDLDLALPTSNPLLVELHDRYAGEYLDRLENAKVSRKIRDMVLHHLQDGVPSRVDIANAVGMSESTLQRRLQEEGTSFHRLVDDIRKELAQRYLKQSQLPISQATYLLGFADPCTFFRACKRWFDMSPNQYRGHIEKTGSSDMGNTQYIS